MIDKHYADCLMDQFARAGILEARLISAPSVPEAFDNAQATLLVGPIFVRVVRERSQQFLELATQANPEKFYQFGDVEISMGWKTVDEVLGKREAESVEAVLKRFKAHLERLKEAFSGDQERFTQVRLEKAKRERGQAFVDRLIAKQKRD